MTALQVAARPLPSGLEAAKQVRREIGSRTLLAFSTGKDSLAAYEQIRPVFDEVIPYYFFLVPGLEFVENSIAYYERKLGFKVVQLPHPSLYRWLNAGAYQTPHSMTVIVAAGLAKLSYKLLIDLMAEKNLLPSNVLAASGVRAADSPIRRVSMIQHGAVSYSSRHFYPVADWTKADVVDSINRLGVKLSVDYRIWGRSFDGLDARFLVPLKRELPEDYRRVLEWFPLADLEVWKFERQAA